jgi:hypothetical protein
LLRDRCIPDRFAVRWDVLLIEPARDTRRSR